MTFRYIPPKGEQVVEHVSTPMEGCEFHWKIPFEVEPYRPATSTGPAEGGFYIGEPTLVKVELPCGDDTQVVTHAETLVALADYYPLSQGEMESAIDDWSLEDVETCRSRYEDRGLD